MLVCQHMSKASLESIDCIINGLVCIGARTLDNHTSKRTPLSDDPADLFATSPLIGLRERDAHMGKPRAKATKDELQPPRNVLT